MEAKVRESLKEEPAVAEAMGKVAAILLVAKV